MQYVPPDRLGLDSHQRKGRGNFSNVRNKKERAGKSERSRAREERRDLKFKIKSLVLIPLALASLPS